ncbi:sugar ABC transporter ATP-binding protein, partial [Rhizobium ruizarguesonis]
LAPVVLMYDPMRGVDFGTKQEVYAIIREEAARVRTFIWYSTEMDEVRLCDRVYVFLEGGGDDTRLVDGITGEFGGDAA